MEDKVNKFFDIVQREFLRYFRNEKGKKNKFISRYRIKLYINDLINHLHSSSFYQIHDFYEHKDSISIPFQRLKFIPFSLFPQKIDKNLLNTCKKCTLLFSSIYDNIVLDLPFLFKSFETVTTVDPFANKLLTICKRVYYNSEENNNRNPITNFNISTICSSSSSSSNNNNNNNNNYSNNNNNNYCRNIKNDIRCLLGRSDYMKDSKAEINVMKQIEYNTISVSLGALSSIISEGHKNGIKKIYTEYFPNYEKNEKEIDKILEKKLQNNVLKGICKCFVECHLTYLKNYTPLFGKHRLISICILQDADKNNHDKLKIKEELKKLGIYQFYFTLKELQDLYEKKKLFLNYYDETIDQSLERLKREKNSCNGNEQPLRAGKLIIDVSDTSDCFMNGYGNCENKQNLNGQMDYESPYFSEEETIQNETEKQLFEVSIVYFRSLYTPKDYNETIWCIREMIEFSDAAKIPSIPYQLVGMKRIQMLLTDDEILRKYISFDINKRKKTEEEIKNDMTLLKKSFALQVDPSLETNEDIINYALKNESQFILKPQREGGLNNLHNEDIKQVLQLYNSKNKKEKSILSSFVLMEKIFPDQFQAVHCRTRESADKKLFFQYTEESSVSELSLYHNFIFDKTGNIMNDQEGYLVRTKKANENEGGVVCGISSLDSAFFV